MDQNLNRLKTSLLATKTSQAACQTLAEWLASLSIYTFAFTYYGRHPKSDTPLKFHYSTESLKAWHEHFVQQHYDDVDSTLNQVLDTTLPVYWCIENQIQNAQSSQERQMRMDSKQFGTVDGLSIPVHGPKDDFAILMLQRKKEEPNQTLDWKALQDILLVACHYFYSHIKKLILKEQPSFTPYQLKPREMQCLQLVADNYAVAEIAKKLHITERTVNFHIQNLNKKLGTKNKYESVQKALSKGLI